MNLSTSSSSSDSAYPALRTIIAALLIGIIIALLIRIYINYLGKDEPDPWSTRRQSEALAQLPDIVKDHPNTVLVFGSSRIQAGFSPAVFNEELNNVGKNATSLNLGFAGLNPELQYYLAQQVKKIYQQHNKKTALTLIEINPFQMTKARRAHNSERLLQIKTNLISLQGILELALVNPDEAARLFAYKYLYAGVLPTSITNATNKLLQQEPDWWFGTKQTPPSLPKIIQDITAIWPEFGEYINNNYFSWQNTYLGGLAPLPKEVNRQQIYKLWQQPDYLASKLQYRINCCDILELSFDQALIEKFVDMIKVLKTISEKSYLILAPDHPLLNLKRNADSQQRLSELLTFLQDQTRLETVDFSNAINETNFIDISHLHWNGAAVFSSLLATQFNNKL